MRQFCFDVFVPNRMRLIDAAGRVLNELHEGKS